MSVGHSLVADCETSDEVWINDGFIISIDMNALTGKKYGYYNVADKQ